MALASLPMRALAEKPEDAVGERKRFWRFSGGRARFSGGFLVLFWLLVVATFGGALKSLHEFATAGRRILPQ